MALRHRQLAPANVDAHALHALLLVMGASLATSASAKGTAGGGPGNPTSGGMPAWLAELVGCLEAMLRCDPGNPVAFEGRVLMLRCVSLLCPCSLGFCWWRVAPAPGLALKAVLQL